MYNQSGMYGYNPCYTLAETPYARMTGMFTPINNQQIPNAASYLQPMFVDMNPYLGNTGIPSYPSFIGGMAMMNPQIPIIQPNQINQWQQQFQNYPQQSYYQQPMQSMYNQQPYYQQPAQSMYYPQQQQPSYYPPQQSTPTIINNYYMGNQQTQQPVYYQQPAQTVPMQDSIMGMFQGMMSSLMSLMSLPAMGNIQTQQPQQPVYYQQPAQTVPMQDSMMGMIQGMMSSLMSMMNLPAMDNIQTQPPAQTVPNQGSFADIFSNMFNTDIFSNMSNMMDFSFMTNTSGNNITNIINIIINGIEEPEPEEVFIVGGYSNCSYDLGDTIGDFANDGTNETKWHSFDDQNDEMLNDLLSKMSDEDKDLKFEDGYAYVISKDGEIIDKIAANQVVDESSLCRSSSAEANDSFEIIEDLGVDKDGRWSGSQEKNNEENVGGQIELNGITYDVASTLIRKNTPLILDLNDDGIDLTSHKDGVNFDLNGDGKIDQTAWTKNADDVFLVYDKNGDGEINSGKELFGDQNGAENGFLELGKYDSNGDGKVDANDDVYEDLQTWSDANHNGKVDEGELKSLLESNVKSLSTGFNKEYDENGKLKEDEHGNTIGLVGSFLRMDGTESKMIDALLQYI